MSEKAGTNYSKSILQAQDVNSKPADELSLTGEKFQAYLQAFSSILRLQAQRISETLSLRAKSFHFDVGNLEIFSQVTFFLFRLPLVLKKMGEKRLLSMVMK